MRRALTFSLLLAAAAVSLPARPSDLAPSPEMKEAEELVARYLATFNSRDLVALSALYTEDGIVAPPAALPVHGRDAIRSYWSSNGRRNLSFQILQKNVCGEAGFFVGRYNAVQPYGTFLLEPPGFTLAVNRMRYGPAGSGPVDGTFTLCLKRGEKGQWLIATDMWNQTIPSGFLHAKNVAKPGYTPADKR